MSENNKDAWYHCGHCGSLFQSDYGHDEDRVCEVCRRKPGVGLWPAVKSVNPVVSPKVASFNKTGEKVKKLGRTHSKRHHRIRTAFVVALIWLVILGLVIGARYYFFDTRTPQRKLVLSDLNKNINASDRLKLLNQNIPECDQVLRGFLSAQTDEERGGFIARSKEHSPFMAKYYKEHQLPPVDLKSLIRERQEWICLGDEWMVHSLWKDNGGNEFDAVFRKELNGWRLDWMHFTRYEETSWKSFLAGEGDRDEAEFRLLAKKVEGTESVKATDQRMMIVLAEPLWGKPGEVILESPIIFIDPTSEKGQSLTAAFELKQKNQSVYQAQFSPSYPSEYIKVRVRISRDELGGEFRIVLSELKACHWLDSDITGF